MPKSQKRTISELLKSRQRSKSSSGVFDLLGEGDLIVAEMADKAGRSEVPSPLLPLEDISALGNRLSYIEGDAALDPAMASIAKVLYSNDFINNAPDVVGCSIGQSSIGFGAIASDAVEDPSVEYNAIAGRAIEASTIGRKAIAESTIASDIAEDPSIGDNSIERASIEESAIEGCAMSQSSIEAGTIASDVMEGNTIDQDSIECCAIAESAVERSTIGIKAIAGCAIGQAFIGVGAIVSDFVERSTIEEGNAIAQNSIVSPAIKNDAIEASVMAEKSKIDVEASYSKKLSIKRSNLKNEKLLSEKTLQGIGRRQAYQESCEEIERLKSNTGATTIIDNYVFDVLFKEINNACEVMVYLYLWRRTYGSGKKNVELSYQVLSDAIGVSKRGGQKILKRLNEKKLITIELESKTGIPSYEVLCPWQKK